MCLIFCPHEGMFKNNRYTKHILLLAPSILRESTMARVFGSFGLRILNQRYKEEVFVKNCGLMFWDYAADPTGALLDAIDTVLWRNSSTAGNQK
jgi:hypothetical protein